MLHAVRHHCPAPDDRLGTGPGSFDPCPSRAFLDCDDNCPIDFNPLQPDTDGDGLGDVCDLQDRRAARVASKRRAAGGTRGPGANEDALLSWIPEEGATSYNVYSGPLTLLAVGDYGRCYRSGLTDAEVVLTDTPAAGSGSFFLISVVDAVGEAEFGVDSDGVARVLDRPCP